MSIPCCIEQSIDFRLRKMEESAEQILSTLAVIHRFMSAHTSIPDNLQGSMVNIVQNETPRLRATSVSEADPNSLHVVNINKYVLYILLLTSVE